MTDQTQVDPLITELDLLHSLSDIYSNLRGRKRITAEHKATLDNLEKQIHTLTNSVLENITNG
jgi:hypothetical protein